MFFGAVGLRAQKDAAGARGCRFSGQLLLREPAIEIECLRQAVLAIRGHHEDGGVAAGVLHDLADQIVAPSIHVFNRVAESQGCRVVVRRVRGIHQPPHHVLHVIERVDFADEQIPFLRVEALQDDLHAIVERTIKVVHERFLVDQARVERRGRFSPAERAIRADAFEDIGGEARGRRKPRRRPIGTPVDGRCVESERRAGARQAEFDHAVLAREQACEAARPEVDMDPFAPFTFFEPDRAAVDLHGRRLAGAVPEDRDGEG